MNFDETFNDMLAVFQNNILEGGGQLKNEIQSILKERKETLEQITTFRIEGELTEEEFKSELEDEKVVLETNLLELKIIEKATVQKAINAAMDVLNKAISKII